MKLRSLLIVLVLVLIIVPAFYLNRWLQKTLRPRENAGRFFLFLFANFVLIIIYTVLVTGVIVRVFGR